MKVPTNNDILRVGTNFDFDAYRQYYSSLSFPERQRISEALDQIWPLQARFNLLLLDRIFSLIEPDIPGAIKILELGCHEGHLAKEILQRVPGFSVQSWVGYDLNARALSRSASIVNDERFSSFALGDWFYNIELPEFNIFLSTHTLEHMVLHEATKIFDHICKKALYLIFEIPIEENGQAWRGYKGSHVLEAGRKIIRKLLSDRGYTCFYEDGPSWTTGWKNINL
uniref:Putative methyltransferase n=1 Tax=viral metagenome TaxID=1070528 RepID=A0A6H1Z7H3_9ZZZZ